MVSDILVAGSIAGVGVLGAFGALAWAYKGASGYLPFLYANARIAARSNYLLSESRQLELAKLRSLKELAAALQNTEYAEEVKGTGDINEFHASLEKGFLNSVSELREMSPEKVSGIFGAYLMLWEAKIVKTIYRARQQDEKIDVAPLVLEAGAIDANLLKKMLETETIPDLKLALSNTHFAPVFEKEYSREEEFEIAIDNIVFGNFVKTVKGSKIFDRAAVMNIFNLKFDILNILALLKARVRGIDAADAKKILINNGSELYNRAGELAEATGIKEFVAKCNGLELHKALTIALAEHEKDQGLGHFERELYHYYKAAITEREMQHPQGPYTVFSHLVKKEIEFRNLLAISNEVDRGINAAKTGGLLA